MHQTFHKRSGTTDKGKDYEVLNTANYVINLVADNKIEEFHISSNDEDFGAFDDIVVETQQEGNTEIYALQLKHKDRGNLSMNQLAQAKGDFSVKKYFTSVQTIKATRAKFILYTNQKFNFTNGTELCLDGEDFPVSITKIQTNDSFEISKKKYCFKFSVVGDYDYSPEVLLWKTFFQNFYLYPDQENIDKLKRSVTENFKTSFCANDLECDQYFKFLNEWSLQVGNKLKLNKKWMKLSIALKILSSRIKPLSFNHDLEDCNINRRNILREAIAGFDITVFGEESYDEVKNLWEDAKYELKDLKAINKLRTTYQLLCNSISDIAKVDSLTLSVLLWLIGKTPLILRQDVSMHKALKLCIGEKFILLEDDCVNSFQENISMFKTLADLKRKTFEYNQVVQNFTCSLQGKTDICLYTLIENNEIILNLLKPDDLLKMYKGHFNIGEVKENLPKSYITRRLLKSVTDINILDNVTQETVIILDCVSQNKELQNRLKRYKLINIYDYLNMEQDQTLSFDSSFGQKSHAHCPGLNTTAIYLCEGRCENNEFNTICKKIQNIKHFHQFRVRDDGNLEWIRSKGDVNDVEKYKLSEYYSTQELDLSSKFENNIQLLVSDPGMGKSELMKSFKNKYFSECLTIIIDPKDVHSFLKNTRDPNHYVEALQKYILDEKYKMLSQRDKDIFRIFFKQNKIVYIWDALDEISDKHRDIVANIVVELAKNCRLQWMTSRCHLQPMLQRKFNVPTLNLSKFDEEEQSDYIRKRLSDVSKLERIEMVIKKIESRFVLLQHKDILGIPLQLFMLTELFRQDRDNYLALLNNSFLLTDLYNHFIEEKINIYYRDKLGLNLDTDSAELLVQSQKRKLIKKYTNAALRLLLPQTILIELGVKQKKILQVVDESHANIGLVTEVTDQIPRFLHNSFAEYLAARYFVNKKLDHRRILLQVMFDPKYLNVRFFFDLLLAENRLAHVAILYRNFSALESCDSEMLTRTDLGGRSVLHLACSWGQSYPELNVEQNEDTYIVDDEGQYSTVPESSDYLEAIDCLLEKCDIYKSDEIYNLTPRAYARKTTCLMAEMRIIMKQSTRKSIENDHIINMLYYSVCYGYYDEFSFFFKLFFQLERNPKNKTYSKTEQQPCLSVVANVKRITGMTLLSIAATMGYIKLVAFLTTAGADINLANKDNVTPLNAASWHGHYRIVEFLSEIGADCKRPNKDGVTPLNAASWQGHYQIAEYLVKTGGDINSANKDGFTPLISASSNGHYNIVKLLVEADADINLANKYGDTPLKVASANGHDKVVEFLVKAGAKNDQADEEVDTSLNSCIESEKIIEFFVRAGADINLPSTYDASLLIVASASGHYDVVEFLVKAGVDVNLANRDGDTALHAASENEHYHIVEFLVKAGININITNKDGLTPLNIASRSGYYKLVKFLVKSGADINFADKDGNTALTGASQNGHDEIVVFLVEANGELNLAQEDGFTRLTAACWNGNDTFVKILVKAGADINLADKNGFTPLYIATQNEHDKIVNLLVKTGVDLNLAQKNGFTPLIVASETGNDKIAEILVKAGAGINLASADGVTPLYIASQNGHDKIVEILVMAGADFNLAIKDGSTPLIAASWNGFDKITEILVKAGADIDLAQKNGFTPLTAAAWNSHVKLVQVLIKAGANVNLPQKDGFTPLIAVSRNGDDKIVEILIKAGADITLANNDGLTALNLASRNGYYKVVEFLVRARADVNLAEKGGFTPLIAASRNGQGKIVEFLVKARTAINLGNKDRLTPLHAAAERGHHNIVEFLIKAGANVNLANKDFFTPLLTATWNGNRKIVEVLVKAGADINLANNQCLTPLNIASWNGHDKIAEILIEAGADLNLAENGGFTPLIAASWNGHDKIVGLLVKAGAAINLGNKDRLTPLHAASGRGHYHIVEFLIKEGASVNLANKDCCTPLLAASWNGNGEIVEILVKAGADINLANKDRVTPLMAASQNGHLIIAQLLVESSRVLT